MQTGCWVTKTEAGVDICGKHKRPPREIRTLKPAPPYSAGLEIEEDLFECPQSGQVFHLTPESAALRETGRICRY
jgi:hypothetical protein